MTEAKQVEGGNPYQRTGAWLHARVGCLTASQAAPLWTKGRGGKPSKARADLIIKLCTERLTGEAQAQFVSQAMQWGTDHEEEARAAYEDVSGNLVDLVGFVKHPSIKWLGASPDGFIGSDGLIEIKCPNSATHAERLMSDEVPEEYVPQMLLQLICTGRKWVDFVDYDPRFPEKLRILVRRFEPTDEQRTEAAEKCAEFLAEVEEQMNKFKELAK